MSEAIRVMLVDDQHLLRMGFRLILEGEDELEVVAEAADGAEALEVMEGLGDQRPDVVLMDVRMPRMDGIEATAKMVEAYQETKVIILTTFDLDEYAFSGLQAGASAFLLKDVEPDDLVSAVRVVAEGDAVVAPRITQRLLEVYLRGAEGSASLPGGPGDPLPGIPTPPTGGAGAGGGPAAAGTGGSVESGFSGSARGANGAATREVATGEPAAVRPRGDQLPDGEEVSTALNDGVPREALTARETEVLFAVAEGLSNAEIAGRFFLSEATVKTHVRRILTKLQLRDRVQAVVYVYQCGLVA